MNPIPDISIIVNAHTEGILAHPTLRSLARSIERAAEVGLRVEVVAVLDRADAATVALFEEALSADGHLGRLVSAQLVRVDRGDLGLSRNDGISASAGRYIGILDSDNLVSSNWIAEAHATAEASASPVVVHPDHIVTFEGRRTVWPMIASEDPRFRRRLLYKFNYWDAFSFGDRSIYLSHPYVETTPQSGLGPEDWHWNAQTLDAGVVHVIAPGTALFYRVKLSGSLMQLHEQEESLLPATSLMVSKEVAAQPTLAATTIELDGRELVTEPSRLERLLASVASGHEASTPLLQQLFVPPATLRHRIGRLVRRKPGESPTPITAESFNSLHYRLRFAEVARLSPAEALGHFRTIGRPAGLPGLLSQAEIDSLRPGNFDVDHYRLRYADIGPMSRANAVRHFLAHGRAEGRLGVLSEEERAAIQPSKFDPRQYRAASFDLSGLNDEEAVAHFLALGLHENRLTLAPAALLATFPRPIDPWLSAMWTEVHDLEPLIAIPNANVVNSYRWYGTTWHAEDHPAINIYWEIVSALPTRVDVVFVAPWVRLGGGDLLLLRYVGLVRRLRPELNVVLITTAHLASTRLDRVPQGVTVVELGKLSAASELSESEERRMLGTLLVQFAPALVHVFNSALGFDVVERFGRALALASAIFLSTFVIERGADGELLSWMTKRRTSFLHPVTRVIVDHAAVVNQFWELYRFDREKFVVHHQAVDETFTVRGARRDPEASVRILWAARFDRQKRPDILALIAERLAERGVAAEIHFYGEASNDAPPEILRSVERVNRAGGVQHPPFLNGLSSVPVDEFDLFLITSEWEGIPILLLEALSLGIPVVAPLVGGIAEVIDSHTAYPVSVFAAVDEYVDQILAVVGDYEEAGRRAQAARFVVERDFSWPSFEAAVRATPRYLPD